MVINFFVFPNPIYGGRFKVRISPEYLLFEIKTYRYHLTVLIGLFVRGRFVRSNLKELGCCTCVYKYYTILPLRACFTVESVLVTTNRYEREEYERKKERDFVTALTSCE